MMALAVSVGAFAGVALRGDLSAGAVEAEADARRAFAGELLLDAARCDDLVGLNWGGCPPELGTRFAIVYAFRLVEVPPRRGSTVNWSGCALTTTSDAECSSPSWTTTYAPSMIATNPDSAVTVAMTRCCSW